MENKGFIRLERNIIDVLKESQIKLGYAYGSMQLYYPSGTLNHMLGTDFSAEEMDAYLDEFDAYVAPRLGRIEHKNKKGRFTISIPGDGLKYVHEHVEASDFLVELVEVSGRHGISFDDIFAVFHKYSDQVVIEEMDNGEFDYQVYFADEQPDDYHYCLHQEGEHIIYHRYSKEDYEEFGF